MEKRLSEFFTAKTAGAAGLVERAGSGDPAVTGIEYDSRAVKPGNIFCALRGLHTDGHRYIKNALAAGASVILHEEENPRQTENAIYLRVKDSRFAMSPVSAAFYGFPSRRLAVIGVTGTEGKSTTVYLIYQLLCLLNKKAGFLSTVQYSAGGEAQWNPQHQTTPEANAVQKLLYEMADNGAEFAVLEASSHGLSPRTNRLGNVDFDAAVMTNVNHEHLEFHGTWEQYRGDKANLFRALDAERAKEGSAARYAKPFGVINADDPSADYFAKAAKRRTVTFSARGMEADLSIRSIESGAWDNWYNVRVDEGHEYLDIRDKLPGAFNAGNVLAALLTVSGLLDIPVRDIAHLVPLLKPVRGRMTAVSKGQPFELVVDYAHTPSSFLSIFPPLRKRLDAQGRRLISVFGSAGERDTKKRAEQGKIAAAYSDFIILTDEDPRGEKPMDILEEIAQGCEADQGCETDQRGESNQGSESNQKDESNQSRETQKTFIRGENLFLIPCRPEAVRKALRLAESGDMVLLLGKGHENSIIYADKTVPYDEIACAEAALAEMGYSQTPR